MLRSSCVALLIFAGVAAADVQTGVVRSGGVPIPGASVTALCGTDKIPTVTDDAGRFELGGLPSTSCKYTVLIFGFEPLQKDAAASSTPLVLDLTLQGHASVPVAPDAPKPVAPPAPTVSTATPAPGAAPAAPATPDAPMPSMAGRGAQITGGRGNQAAAGGRGGQAGGGRGGQAGGRGGFQALSMTQNGDAVASDAPAALIGGADAAGGSGASDAFTVNGTVSAGVQAQAGDGFGMGGPGGFGFGAGGPGGPGGDFGGGQGGPGGPGGPGGGGGRGGGGRGGDGGGGGNAFGGGGGPGGGGGFGGGPGGGGGFGGGGGGGGRGGPGGPGGAGRGGPNGVTSFGNRAGRGRGPQWQASVTYNFANSALNARPFDYSAGVQPAKAATATNQGGVTLGGPIMIPKTKVNLKNSRWNFNFTAARNRAGVDPVSSVPTTPLRNGDFSSLLGTTTIYDPASGGLIPFTNNIIPASRISPAATALLAFFPGATGPGLRNNYQFVGSNPTNNNNTNIQVSEPITTKDRINLNISYQSRNSAQVQNFGFRDPTTGSGGNISLSYSKTLQPTLVNTFTLGANRNATNNLSYFSNGANVAANLGINGVLATPATYGPPTLSFANYSGLNDGTPSENHSTTYSLTDSIVKNKGKHNFTVGLTGSMRDSNSLTASNARGNFGFTGVNTEQVVGGVATTSQTNPTGYDLADLLLGLPASASANKYLNGDNTFYYRQKTAAAYISDDYRVTTALTLSLGLRWEFYGPETEKYNHMANVEFGPTGTVAEIVTPGQQNPFASNAIPSGILNPDFKMYEPQLGFAWKPWAKKALVLRGGYGIRYNGGAIAQMGNQLSIQPPFVQTLSLTVKTTPGLTLLNGLVASPLTTVANTYSVSPNYTPARAQQWNMIAQYTLGRSYVAQLSYFGTKGSNLDVLLGPNRLTPGGSILPYANATSTIQFDESVGTSINHTGSAQLTRRFARGISGSGTYTLAKTLSDSSTLGGGVVQIENNILAERAVTNAPHQTFNLNFNYQTLAGNQKSSMFLNVVRGWQLNGGYSVNSGSPFTATVSGDPSGTGIIGSARANATGLPVQDGVGYFNPAAFTTVPSGTYGTAGRNTIPGIVNFSLNANAARTFRLGEKHRLQLTFITNNPLNHPSVTGINTVIGSALVGTQTGAGQMRTVSANARFTF